MNEFIESLKRLYAVRKIDESILVKLYENQKITRDEMQYILGKDGE